MTTSAVTGAELHEQLSWWWEQRFRPHLPQVTDADVAGALGERLQGITVLLAQRASFHFGDRSLTDDLVRRPADAADALRLLDEAWSAWDSGLVAADPGRLQRPHQGPPGTADERYPLWAIVLHVNREVVHLGAQVLLLLEQRIAQA